MAVPSLLPAPSAPLAFVPLPSQVGAAALLSGDLSAAPTVALHLLGRAALIALGMAVVGEREPRRLIGGSLAGSVVIECFVLAHELTNRPRS
jgi:hypothetical protein